MTAYIFLLAIFIHVFANADVTCPWYNGLVARCNGCQYCPDGSICPNCVLPGRISSAAPVASSTSSQVSAYVKCPFFGGNQVSCTGCQYCPDGSICPNCVLPGRVPSAAPLSSPPIGAQVNPSVKCPYFGGSQVSCNGCQYCPDGSLCPNCILPQVLATSTAIPTIMTTAVPTLDVALEPTNATPDIIVTSEPTTLDAITVPTSEPTESTVSPTVEPTLATAGPTLEPTTATVAPTIEPTIATIQSSIPTLEPSMVPTKKPRPSKVPTYAPTSKPTHFTCPLYKGQRVICTGCKTCPDGSLCPRCVVKVKSNAITNNSDQVIVADDDSENPV